MARWRKVLKSGVDARRAAERLERAATVNAAWRSATLLGRATPRLPAEATFSDVEIGVLRDFATDLPEPLDLNAAVLAMIGVAATDRPATRRSGKLAAHGAGLRNRVAADEPRQQLRPHKTCD